MYTASLIRSLVFVAGHEYNIKVAIIGVLARIATLVIIVRPVIVILIVMIVIENSNFGIPALYRRRKTELQQAIVGAGAAGEKS